MKVKELLKQLKGQYTDVIPFHTDKRDVIPFTHLGEDLENLTGKAFNKVFNEKEVVEYELGEWLKTPCWTFEELFIKGGVGHYKMTRTLIIYFK